MYDNIRIIIAPIILLFIFSCDDMATNVTGSENVNEIANVSFSNIEKTITGKTQIFLLRKKANQE